MVKELSSFCFILDSILVSGELPIEIIPGHLFRKATYEEIKIIKNQLTAQGRIILPYEYELVNTEKGNQFSKLPRQKWNYHVISFSGSNSKLGDLEYPANLLRNSISFGYTFLYNMDNIPGPAGIVSHPPSIATFFVDHYHIEPSNPIESSELHEIQVNYDNINILDSRKYENIHRAISNFHDSKMITNRSLLKALSYFSILECLLTHHPTVSTDSLTHQIKTKMSLLSKLFQRELNYEQYFPELPEPEKAWSKLYKYRSEIVHGGEVNFNDSSFRHLLSRINIQNFLKESIKLLLLYSIKEPEFITNFKKC